MSVLERVSRDTQDNIMHNSLQNVPLNLKMTEIKLKLLHSLEEHSIMQYPYYINNN